MMLWVVNAKLLKDYQIQIEFNDGLVGVVDFQKLLEKDKRPIVRELLNPKEFNDFTMDRDTICWNNGVDFAPEYLRDNCL